MSPRYAAKVDGNQKPIVEALRSVGAGVLLLHRLGEDVPDALVSWNGRTVLVEIKNPDGRDLVSDGQARFAASWPGGVVVVRSVEEALAAIGIDAKETSA